MTRKLYGVTIPKAITLALVLALQSRWDGTDEIDAHELGLRPGDAGYPDTSRFLCDCWAMW